MAKPKEPENTRIWDVLGRTDPAHTKQFTRAGGFRGTAVKPMWANKQMTEMFGPCGIGWGQTEPQFQTITTDGEILVYCTAGIWYIDNDKASKTVYGVGGDKVLTQIFDKDSKGQRYKGEDGRYKTYPQTDDEAFKKAYTDALSNAMKFIGVAADVHMGMFDDNKYVQSVAAEFKDEAEIAVRAEVERQKAAATPLKELVTSPTSDVPPELDWSWNKASGVLICRLANVKKAKNKKGTEFLVVTLNGYVSDKNEAFYFHKSHVDELMGAQGKVCKFAIIESKGFVNIDEVLEIDEARVDSTIINSETEARLLASVLELDEEQLREVHGNLCGGSWTLVLEKLKEEQARREGIAKGQA